MGGAVLSTTREDGAVLPTIRGEEAVLPTTRVEGAVLPTQGSYTFFVRKFHDFSRTFPGFF